MEVGLSSDSHKVREFGQDKARNLDATKKEEADLLARFRSREAPLPIAAE